MIGLVVNSFMQLLLPIVEVINNKTKSIMNMHPIHPSIKLHLLGCIETAKLMGEPRKAEL